MIIRPAATSSRICSAVRCGSRAATAAICGVTIPRRACSSCVTGATAPEGRKSHAVLSLGGGIPGVSGDEYAYGVPTLPGFVNEPGVVTCRSVEGFSPRGGSAYERSVVVRLFIGALLLLVCVRGKADRAAPRAV